MAKLTELQEMRLPILEARAKNRAKKDSKTRTMAEGKHNKALRKLNRAIDAGLTTEKQFKASGRKFDDLAEGTP